MAYDHKRRKTVTYADIMAVIAEEWPERFLSRKWPGVVYVINSAPMDFLVTEIAMRVPSN